MQVTNPFRGTSLGNQDKSYFTTTNKVLLKAWDNAEIAKLDDKKLKELRSHHFKLGSYNPNEAMTTNKIYYDTKPITGEASKNQEESKKNMRGHHHDFKEVSFRIYSKTILIIAQHTPTNTPPKKETQLEPSYTDKDKMPSALEPRPCPCSQPTMLHTPLNKAKE